MVPSMVSSRRSRTLIILVLLIALAAVCVFMDLSWISERKCYSFSEVWDALTGNGTWASETKSARSTLPVSWRDCSSVRDSQ